MLKGNDMKGIALIYIALVILLVGVAIVFGIRMMGPQVAKDKRLATKNIIDVAADAVIGFVARNDRLPTDVEFKGLVRNNKDVWGRELEYYPDSSLVGTGATICGKATTDTIVRNCADEVCTASATDSANIAFVILSGGENMNIQTLVASSTIKTYEQGLLGIDDYSSGTEDPDREEIYKDIMKVVNLSELKVKAGCFGDSSLKIVNSSLPSGTINVAYDAYIFAENGVLFADGGDSDSDKDYQWCVQETLPNNLTFECNGTFTPTGSCNSADTWNQCTKLRIIGTPIVLGTTFLHVFVRDDDANVAEKLLPLTIMPEFAIGTCNEYRVWRVTTSVDEDSFFVTNHGCQNYKVANSEITSWPTFTLSKLEVIRQYEPPSGCTGPPKNVSNYNLAIIADGNHDCCVGFSDGGPPDYVVMIDYNCPLGVDADGDGSFTPYDCNDNNASIRPGATELCDGIDNDCDLVVDEGFNIDGDAYKTCQGDCNDLNPLINPGAAEVCDGVDNDCDLLVDEGFNADNDGYTTCQGDCNDTNASVHPGAYDNNCNGVDEDCDGTADEAYPTTPTTCGLGICAGNTGQNECQSGVVVNTCAPYLGSLPDDSICNGLDDDCNGAVDEDYVITASTCGVGACLAEGENRCVSGVEKNICTPGSAAPDDATCDGVDDDCDGAVDEDYVITASTCGVGACFAVGENQCVSGSVANTCTPGAPTAESPDAGTCDDGEDNDCDGSADDADSGCISRNYYCDSDGDTYFSLSASGSCSSSDWFCAPTGCGYSGTDCNDANAAVHPGAAEVCDNVDNNCSGAADEGLVRESTCGVGICAGNTGTENCSAGTWGNNTCNPYAGKTDENSPATCGDYLDNDCDGGTDMADNDCTDVDICSVSGLRIRNNTGNIRQYDMNPGTCTAWPVLGNITVGTTGSINVYNPSSGCTALRCTPAYSTLRSYDGDNDCQIRMADNNPCTFVDE